MVTNSTDEPDLQHYIRALHAMLRQRSPAAYRLFLAQWQALHQRGAAQRLLEMDDAALRLRIEQMILDQPGLADLHPSARAYLRQRSAPPVRAVRLRRRPRP